MAKFRPNDSAIDDLLTSSSGHVGRHLIKVCIRIVGGAKRIAPVDTGRLRSSITFELINRGTLLIGRVGTNVEYAIFVHEGTRFMQGVPFLREALYQEVA